MTRKEKVHLCVASAAVILAYRYYRRVRLQEIRKRNEIANDTERQMIAIARAGAIVRERIRQGKYREGGLPEVMEDFEFQTILANEGLD